MQKAVIKYQNLANLLFNSGKTGKKGVTPQRISGKETTPPHAEFAGILVNACTVLRTAPKANVPEIVHGSKSLSPQSAPKVSPRRIPVAVSQATRPKTIPGNTTVLPQQTVAKQSISTSNQSKTSFNPHQSINTSTPTTKPAVFHTAQLENAGDATLPAKSGLSRNSAKTSNPSLNAAANAAAPLQTPQASSNQPGSAPGQKLAAQNQPTSQPQMTARNASIPRVQVPEYKDLSQQVETPLAHGVDPKPSGRRTIQPRQQTVHSEPVVRPVAQNTASEPRPGLASQAMHKLADNTARIPASIQPQAGVSTPLPQKSPMIRQGFPVRLQPDIGTYRPAEGFKRQESSNADNIKLHRPSIPVSPHPETAAASEPRPGLTSQAMHKLADNTARIPASIQPQAGASTPLPQKSPMIRQGFPVRLQPDIGTYRPAEGFKRQESSNADNIKLHRPSIPVSPHPETAAGQSEITISGKLARQHSEPAIKQTSPFHQEAATASIEPGKTADLADPAGDDTMQNVPRQNQTGTKTGGLSGGHSDAARTAGTSSGGATSFAGSFNHFFGAGAFAARAKAQNQSRYQADKTQILAESENETQPLSTEQRAHQASRRTESTPTPQAKTGRKLKISPADGNAQKSTMEEMVRQMKVPRETASSQPRSTTPEALQNLANLADKIRARAQLLNPKGSTIINAKLSPAGFGTVRIQLEVIHDQMQLHFSADRPEATIALQNSRADLGALLADHGYNLTQCDVQDQPPQNRLTDMTGNSDSHRRPQNPKSSFGKGDDRRQDQTVYKGMLDYGYNTLELVA